MLTPPKSILLVDDKLPSRAEIISLIFLVFSTTPEHVSFIVLACPVSTLAYDGMPSASSTQKEKPGVFTKRAPLLPAEVFTPAMLRKRHH